jgi:pyrroloquinoline quinone (PQQ) biosynthesis protein C
MELDRNLPSLLLEETTQSLRAEVAAHPFLDRFRSGPDRTQMSRFAVQWHITAKLHKDAFPAVILNTPDEETRFDLIEILREEYGSGDREKIHTKSLRRFLISLGVDPHQIADGGAIPEVKHFGDTVLSVWRDASPARAFGLHFALETIASLVHDAFAEGIMASQIPLDNEYFEMHRTAEQGHADVSIGGFLRYALTLEDRTQLLRGVEDARELLRSLLDGLMAYVFSGDSARAA